MGPLFVVLLYPVLFLFHSLSEFAWKFFVLKTDHPLLCSSVIFHSPEYYKFIIIIIIIFDAQLVSLFSKNADLPQTHTVHILLFRPSSVLGLIARGKDVRICLS